MTIWSGCNPQFAYQERNEPYEGCLVVMNVGSDTGMPTEEQRVMLNHEVDYAHANGWLVVYAFDDDIGVSTPPPYVEAIEDMDLPILAKAIFGRDKFELAYELHKGNAEFATIAARVFDGNGPCAKMKFERRAGKVMGFATVEGKKVFIPPVRV